nr:ankyrin-3-like isoform X2 [Halyomorpha halys]
MLGYQRMSQLYSEIFNEKLNKALQFAIHFSIYDDEITLRELTTAQSLLLSVFYGLLHQDFTFCMNLIESSSTIVQLKSSYIKVWLKDDFSFKQMDVAKAFSNLAIFMDCKFPSQLKLPRSIAVAFSGLVDKYKLVEVYRLSEDKKALELVYALNSFVLGLADNVEATLESNSAAAESEVVTRLELDTETTQSNESNSVAEESEVVTDVGLEATQSNETSISQEESTLLEREYDLSEGFVWIENEEAASSPVPAPAHPELSTIISHEDEPTLSPEEAALSQIQSEVQRPNDNEATPPPLQPQVEENEARGSSSHITLEPRPEVQRLNDNEATPSPLLPQVEENEARGSSSRITLEPRPEAGNRLNRYYRLGSSVRYNEDRIYRSLKDFARDNDPSHIRQFIVPGIDVNRETDCGNRLLHIAVYHGSREAVLALLECGALPEMKNQESITPLQLAIRYNFPSIFQVLLEYVSDINQVFDKGNTLLHEVASEGTSHDLYSVLRYNPNVDLKNNFGYTALHLATLSGHTLAVKALINAGADVNALSRKGEMCLHIAVDNSNASVLRCLLPRANIHYKNSVTRFTALHTAAYNGDCKCIKALLHHRLNVNTRTYNSRTALHEAAEQGHIDAVDLLLSRGAAVNAVSKNKWTPLHCAAAGGFDEVVTALLNYGAHINGRDSYGNTPLKLAKSKCRYIVVAALSKRGATL